MGNIQSTTYFKDTSKDYTCENLSNMVFKDIDYRNKGSISFFRSDFSRCQLINCFFTNNNFGRADFISAFISNTTFKQVNFGSCLIKNTTLEKVSLSYNNYRGVAIQYSYFKDCSFNDERIITNMYNTVFDNCTFINCKFEKSSLDNNTFINCHLENVDISECIAENLKFNDCELNNVYFGSSLWATYLYKKTKLNHCKFKYRGEIVDVWTDEKKKFTLLKKEGRYFEYLNTIIVSELYKNSLFDIVSETISSVLSQDYIQRKNNMSRILDMLIFYSDSSYIPVLTYLKIFELLTAQEWNSIRFEERLNYEAEIYKIEKIISAFVFSPEMLISTPLEEKCICKFHLSFNNEQEALAYLEKLFVLVNEYYFDGVYITPLFKVVSKEKGSIILSIASASALALLVSYVVKKISHNLISVKVEHAISKEFIKAIQSGGSDYSTINKTLKLAEKYNFLSDDKDLTAINKISKDMTIDNVIEVILNFLF